MNLDHAQWMEIALDEARRAAARGEVPVGAVVVCGDQIVARDHNRTREAADPTAHAEVRVLRAAAAELGDWRLTDCVLYVTLEPCAMCAGAIVLARIERLVFAARDPKAGMCGSLGNLVEDARLNHRVEVESGVLAEQSGELLREFFREKR
ncbi:MAG: tRNA adenosine(34) deaminase TadA [Gemmatimonadales bacterium]|jgi:tRNA(adenine34) deaminase